MNKISKELVSFKIIEVEEIAQRIDNYLIRILKGVPKSHIYRILRSGEIRVNRRRVEPSYRLQQGDTVRIPPIRVAQPDTTKEFVKKARLTFEVLYEDDYLLAINKPAGVAVHGGSGVSRGVIEELRLHYTQLKFLELVHRLDRETSGVLLLAKKRTALVALHEAIKSNQIKKYYLVLVKGRWPNQQQHVKLPLLKFMNENEERRVVVHPEGKASHTFFTLNKAWQNYSLLQAELMTGRTHQIRVHLAHLGYPIVGDDKYGDFALNKALDRQGIKGIKRMFLHAAKLIFNHPITGQPLLIEAVLPPELARVITLLDSDRFDLPSIR